MRDELTDRDTADIVAAQFRHVFDDGVIEPQFAAQRAERDQRRLEQLPHRSDVEQRVGRDRPLRGLVGEAVVEVLDTAFEIDGCGKSARIGCGQRRIEVGGHDISQQGNHVDIRQRARHQDEKRGKQDGRYFGKTPQSHRIDRR